MPARIMLRARNVEYFLQPATKHKIYKRYKNNGVRRDLIILTRGKLVSEIENTANMELTKISKWARNNKVRFNDK